MEKTEDLFSNRQIYRLLWPLLIEQLLNVLVGMVDVVMVASLGEAAVSGVSLVDSINNLVIQFLAAMTAGGTVVCSQFIGMKNEKKANQSAGQLFFITVSSSAALAVFCLIGGTHLLKLIFGQVEADVMGNAYTYFMITALSFPFLAMYNSGAALFRSMENSQISMRVSMFMNGLNVVGNAICIFGLKMGVSGVAVPTLISRMTAAFLIVYLLQKPENRIQIQHISDMKPDLGIIGRILSIGIPGGVESGMFQFGKLMLQSLVSTLGTSAIAGYAVACNLVTFLYLPGNALGLCLTTIVGQCVGAGLPEQAKKYTRKLLVLNYGLLAVIASVLAFGRYFWIHFYNLADASADIAAGLVLAHSIAMIIWPVAFLIPHALRAANDAAFTMVIAVVSMWVFRVAFAYLFVKGMHLSIYYVWYAMFIDWMFRTIVFLWRFSGFDRRIRKIVL